MPHDQHFSFGYGKNGLEIEGRDGEDIVLEVPWEFLPAFVLIVSAFSKAHDELAFRKPAN